MLGTSGCVGELQDLIVLQPINKMFATYYYDSEMSKMDFDYQLVSFEESLKRVAKTLRS